MESYQRGRLGASGQLFRSWKPVFLGRFRLLQVAWVWSYRELSERAEMGVLMMSGWVTPQPSLTLLLQIFGIPNDVFKSREVVNNCWISIISITQILNSSKKNSFYMGPHSIKNKFWIFFKRTAIRPNKIKIILLIFVGETKKHFAIFKIFSSL